jgi:hypothetical protein
MKAIVNSIHSQVASTIEGLPEDFASALSLDSHLDVSLGGDYGVYPDALRTIAERTSAHSSIRASLRGKGGDLIVAIPERMLTRHAAEIELSLPRSLRVDEMSESVALVVTFLKASMGIEVYPSPPRRLADLAPRLRARGSWLLDVDVDCMAEMQGECYTQIRGVGPGVLMSSKSVIGFIRSSKPEVITISEAMVRAVRDKESHFSQFLESIRGLGYAIEEEGVYDSDEDVVRGIEVCKEFYREVSTRLLREHMGSMMRGDYSGFEREERLAAKEFFPARGYPVSGPDGRNRQTRGSIGSQRKPGAR